MFSYLVEFEDNKGKKFTKTIVDCPSIEDATIEADNMADDNGWDMLAIDEII